VPYLKRKASEIKLGIQMRYATREEVYIIRRDICGDRAEFREYTKDEINRILDDHIALLVGCKRSIQRTSFY
jgi:hypothetical protein